jgi:hypothetical protein
VEQHFGHGNLHLQPSSRHAIVRQRIARGHMAKGKRFHHVVRAGHLRSIRKGATMVKRPVAPRNPLSDDGMATARL